ncbi:hypothetical protein PRZ48_008232 [Zasmidium cellare]|uniref:Uncharacterized protein n=1 Tax=Zasmidium cellare TaxID=395010 RepID=A0ABR0EFN4_ZASCE|nr:hypothetical protein PRZ48_008232 [Zasmidium cellare]
MDRNFDACVKEETPNFRANAVNGSKPNASSSSNTTVKANANAKKPRRDSEAEKSDPSPSIDSLGMTSPHDDIYMPIGDLDEVLDLWAFTENDVLDTSFDLSSTSDLTPEIQITDWLVPTKRKSNHLDESSDTIGGETIVPLLSSSASGSDPGIEDVFTSLLRSNTLIATTKIADQRAAEAISHLSQLNVHLYTLHHACGGLQNPGPDFVASQTNNGECLELVAYWLLGMDLKTLDSKIDQPNPANNVTVGRVLHQTFATSHKLLSLLQNFDASLANHLLSATIQDMVLLSHTLLLGIFAKTLAIVEQHVETGNFSSPIAEVRVVSVVQLCPYIIERQTEAVNLHVSRNLPDSTNAPDGSTAHLANLQGLQMAANEKISEILARLRTCLRI